METLKRKKIMVVLGTRPEAIKLAPIIKLLESESWAEAIVVNTGQHKQLVDQVLGFFEIKPKFDLELMTSNQTLNALLSRAIMGIDHLLEEVSPDLVLVQGDTSTVLASAISAANRRIPVAHVEAGLRTYDRENPFPEELNRVLVSAVAQIHFAPTAKARDNLLQEGVADCSIHLTGNSVVDALNQTLNSEEAHSSNQNKLILVTAHRRENIGDPLIQVSEAIRELSHKYKGLEFLVTLHPNPNIGRVLDSRLSGLERVTTSPPLGYKEFVEALQKSWLVMTDSGGVQEEAPSLGKPVLILRDVTERPEIVESGHGLIVGTNARDIILAMDRLMSFPDSYQKMVSGPPPFGKGGASLEIVRILKEHLVP